MGTITSSYGYGYGYGYGSGDGDGIGDGDGYGYGYGYGSGDGYGDGIGYGYGYGSGDGSGYGHGYGSGDGYWAQLLVDLGAQAPDGAICAYWRSGRDGRPANGGSGDPVYPGLIQEECGPLNPCERGALHATLNPPKWNGPRLWIVIMHPPFIIVDESKIAGLKREIVREIV